MPIIKARSSSIINSVDLRGTPTAPTAADNTNTTQIATTAFVSREVSDLINSAPQVLDTLAELAAAINNDESFASTVTGLIAEKVALAGDTMTGFLTLSADPVNNLHAATKQYVDDGINAITISSTDDVPEGSINLYYTSTRVRDAVSLTSDNTTVLDYDNATGIFTYNHPTSDGILEGATNQYFSQTRARESISINTDDNSILDYSQVTGEIVFTTPDTDKIVEGSTNQYFLTSRARASISNGSNISYDSGTGIISTQAAVWSVNGQEHAVVLDTDNIDEGSTNLYFTQERGRGAVSLTTDDSNILGYNSGTGVFTFATPTTDAIGEGSNNLYYTDNRARTALSASGDISYNSATGNFSYSTPTTDGVNEGSTNKYFTDTRARQAISLTSSNTSVLSYDNATGAFTFSLNNQTTDDVAEGTANKYFTDTRARDAISVSGWGNLSYNSSTGVISISAPSTDDVSEGANLYFTQTRARDSVSATKVSGDGAFLYDSATGVFSYTGPDDTDYRGAVSANAASGDGNLQYDSSTGVFTYDGPTNADYRGAVSAYKASGDGDLQYDSSTGVFTYTGPSASETRAHLSATTSGTGHGGLTYDSATGVFTYAKVTSANVRGDLSATSATGISYDSSTGVFSLSGIPNSSLTNSSISFNGKSISLGGSDTLNTDDIGEGSTNLYYTTARTRADVNAVDSENVGAFSYSSATGEFTFDASAVVATVNGQAGYVTLDTDDVNEGTGNLYYTTARTRADVGAGTGVSYNSSTGVFSIGQAVGTSDDVTFNDVTVSGDLTVNGTLTTINSTELTVTDKNITIADGAANAAAANGAGITVDGANATITYASATDSWDFNKDVNVAGGLSITGSLSAPTFTGDLTGDVTGTVSDISNHTTDALTEGSTNLYFTDSRARGAVSLTSDKTSVLSYNASTGVFTFAIANASTSDIAEGTNLYFTDTRARAAISVTDNGGDGSLSYDSATGAISYTGPSATDTRAHFSATTSGTGFGGLSYDSTTGAFTFAKVTSADVRGEVSATKVSGDGNFSYDSSTGVFSYTGPDNADYRDAVSAQKVSGDGNFSYDSSTGVFSYTGPSAADVRAHFSAGISSGITYDSSNGSFVLTGIPNASISNPFIEINGTTINLGGSDTLDTDDIGEGSTNQYFTDTRARNAISLTSNDLNVLSYDSATGEFVFDLGEINTDGLTEGATNLFFTQTRARDSISVSGDLSYNSSTGVISYSTPTTDGINEGTTNKYFTDTRARQAISLTTDNTDALSYDNQTGEFHFTLNSVDTDEIAEGQTRFYFTTQRARDSISSGSNINYDASTGIISTLAAVESVNGQTGVVVLDTDNISEGSTNLYFADSLARSAVSLTSDNTDILAYNSGTGVFTFATPTTDAITEGANNLYYTEQRVDDRIGAASIRDLSDVNKTEALQDGYTLVWSTALGEFVPQNVAVTATNLNFTGDGTTTDFSTGVEVSSIDNTQVYINGLIQAPTYSYTISTTNGVTSIVMTEAPEANDYIMIRVSSTSSLTAGGVLNEQSNIDGGTY